MRHSLRTLVLTTVVLSLTGCGYNKLQELDEGVNKAQAQIQTQLQRRADLIPNLVETVKGVAAQETSRKGPRRTRR
jgi:LemA protein